jgi:seryl-tRNA synthetase
MHDIKFIRQSPDAFDAGLARRGLPPMSQKILELDAAKRAVQTELQDLQSKRNQFAKAIGEAKKKGEDATVAMEAAKANNDRIAAIEADLETGGELQQILVSLPNLPADDVPEGKDETGNKVVCVVGEKPQVVNAKEHFEIGEALGMMDFDAAAKISGSRFVVLKGGLARLERALASFMLDTHTQEFGYAEIVPPYLVRDGAAFGTGQLPKFSEDLFKTENGYWLIPTAEVPLTNLVNDAILKEDALPLRFTAYSPCFRSEAGAAGRDTRGMIRQHQFSKVELVSIAHPLQSNNEHERMTACAEEILKRLGLHFRTMLLCTGDMGFSAQKTYDIEVWLPGQNAYREISSCSNCGAFQARRMKARFKADDKKETEFVHTLNGSALAIGRTMIAILENYQQPDGSVAIPEALQPYMGGLKKISK